MWPSHAIERCSLTIAFKEEIPEKLFASAKSKHKATLDRLSFVQQPALAMSFDVLTGQVQTAPMSAQPVTFNASDSSGSFTMTNRALVWGNSRYKRWKQFKEQLDVVLFPVVKYYLEVTDAAVVRLDYLDRFIWSGSWDDFDLSSLLKKDFVSIPMIDGSAKRERHSHNGWFETNGRLRRLINRNLDVVEGKVMGVGATQPSVGIYTLIQDEYLPQSALPNPLRDLSEIQRTMELQHIDLKEMMVDTISESMAKRISLSGG